MRTTPSQTPRHASLVPEQAGRTVPRGAPVTAIQVPLNPGSPHASHCPAHRLPQQTPSTQAWLVHSSLSRQASPFAFNGRQALLPGSQY